jgi:N,N-dimethylformamidase
MHPLTGYADRWSARPGETIRFMLASQDNAPFQARCARILCGDPNPAGPGYREQPITSPVDGSHPGRQQTAHPGSHAEIPLVSLAGAPQGIAILATILPTRVGAAQTVLQWQGQAATLTLEIDGQGAAAVFETADTRVRASCNVALHERRWYDLVLLLDIPNRRLSITQSPRRPIVGETSQTASAELDNVPALNDGHLTIAASRTAAGHAQYFNGKIERPTLHAAPTPSDAPILAAWDFAIGIPTDTITDIGPSGWHGTLVNLPTRAMTGPSWTAAHQRWTDAPQHHAAIHFHDDDIGDVGWDESLALTIPADWPSGLYALHLTSAHGRDNIPFMVRALKPGSQSRVALLMPSFTYQIYGQFVRAGRGEQIAARAAAWNSLAPTPDLHPEFGLSPYNLHSDGSGVGFASMRRPMIDKRVGQFHLMDPSEAGSGTYWITADSYILDCLDRAGIACEVITDHDVHAEGQALLDNYDVVLTGQHPEYHSDQTLDAIAGYLDHGGRLLYLGGNGFYWKVVPHPDGPWALELRRTEGGIRMWATEPGESYHAFDGTYGGLWRRLGRPPQALVGVGFSTQGTYRGYPFHFTDAIADPRVAFMCEGVPAATPGAVFGERGVMGGGAAGHELDRADIRLGTPPDAIIVAEAVVTDPGFQPVNEERLTETWPAAPDRLIRADVTYFTLRGGGAVFSAGSMNWIGGLPVDGYENTLARLTLNVVRHFAATAAPR